MVAVSDGRVEARQLRDRDHVIKPGSTDREEGDVKSLL